MLGMLTVKAKAQHACRCAVTPRTSLLSETTETTHASLLTHPTPPAPPRRYLSVDTTHRLVVDTTRMEQLDITFDVTFPRAPCTWLTVDVMDSTGDAHMAPEGDVTKYRLDAKGNVIDVYGTNSKVRDSCGRVRCGWGGMGVSLEGGVEAGASSIQGNHHTRCLEFVNTPMLHMNT